MDTLCQHDSTFDHCDFVELGDEVIITGFCFLSDSIFFSSHIVCGDDTELLLLVSERSQGKRVKRKVGACEVTHWYHASVFKS